VAVLREPPNPPRAAQATPEIEVAVRLRLFVSAEPVIELTLPEWQGRQKSGRAVSTVSRSDLPRNNRVRGQRSFDGEQNTGSFAFAHHAHDVVSGGELLSIHRFVEVRFGFALQQNHRGC